MYKLEFSPQALEFYQRLYFADRGHFLRVDAALESLQKDPFQGKALVRSLKGCFSLRVGVYQIIYSLERKVLKVAVLKIGHRKDVYHS